MRPVVLYRKSVVTSKEDGQELAALRGTNLPVIHQRTQVQSGDLVVGRYSVLPWYKELEEDVRAQGGQLINSHAQHRYVADLQNYVQDLKELTPRTWFRLHDASGHSGPFVLKGETNSRKNQWDTHMYAADFPAAVQVYQRLQSDGLIGQQDVYVREYVPLNVLLPGSPPITEEFRFFVLDGEILAGGFYWSSHVPEIEQEYGVVPSPVRVPGEFLREAIARVKDSVRFFVMDVARTVAGNWVVIELNDGQMSGLSEVDPWDLYAALARKLRC